MFIHVHVHFYFYLQSNEISIQVLGFLIIKIFLLSSGQKGFYPPNFPKKHNSSVNNSDNKDCYLIIPTMI